MSDQNPVEQRLGLLCDQWSAFARDPSARLLRWLAAADELPMVEAFVAKESEPDVCDTPDLFLRFDTAFEHAAAHGFVLRDALARAWDEARASLEESTFETASVAPHASRSHDDIRAFLRLLLAYHAQQQGQVALLVAFLLPATLGDPAAYQLWLQRLILQAPAQLRFLVVDSLERPQLSELASAHPELVISVVCELGMSAAGAELLQASGSDTPGGRFRELFAALGDAAKAGDLRVAVPLAESATRLATSLGWPHLAAVVQTLLAGIYGCAGDPFGALRCYAEVQRLADETHAHGRQNLPAPEGAAELEGEVAIAYGLRLKRDARFGQGACLIAQHAWEHGATVFLDAAASSRELHDARGELDALRLASLCFERHGALQHAWQCGMKGLEVAAGMDAETRRTSTLAYLAEGMLRLSGAPELSAYRDPVARRLDQLLEPGWRKALHRRVA